jgi:hypothetical protein
MAAQVSVADASDPRLADYVSLTDVHLRRSLEAAQGLFIAEGEKVIRRAVAAGFPVRSFLVVADKLDSIQAVAAASDAPLYVLPAQAAEQLTGFRVHRGALASMQRLPLPAVRDVVAEARRIVVLEDIVDHANVGYRQPATLHGLHQARLSRGTTEADEQMDQSYRRRPSRRADQLHRRAHRRLRLRTGRAFLSAWRSFLR